MDALSPPLTHHKRSTGSLSSPSPSSPSSRSSGLRCSLRRRRPLPPPPPPSLSYSLPRCRRRQTSSESPHPHLLLLHRGRPDLLLVGGVTDPPLKIHIHSSPSPPSPRPKGPPSPCLKGLLLCGRGGQRRDVVDVVISSWIVVIVIASPPSLPRSAASSEPLPDNRRYVACLDSSWEGCVCEDSVLKRPRVMPTEK